MFFVCALLWIGSAFAEVSPVNAISRPLPSLPELERALRGGKNGAPSSSDLAVVREAYATLWVEQRRQPLLSSFLADRDRIMGILTARAEKKILPDFRLLEYASFFDLANRDVAYSRAKIFRALSAIGEVTGNGWSLPEGLEPPVLPEAEVLRKPSETGSLQEHLLWSDYSRESLRYETTRLAGARERMRQDFLRYGSLPEETIEKLTDSRNAFLRAAMDLIDAENSALRTFVELLAAASPGGRTTIGEGRAFPLPDADRRDELLSAPVSVALPADVYSAPARLPEIPGLPALPVAAAEKTATPKEPPSGETVVIAKEGPVYSASVSADTSVSSASSVPVPSVPQVPTRVERQAVDARPQRKSEAGRWAPRYRAVYVWDAEPLLDPDRCGPALDRMLENRFTRILVSFSPRELENMRSEQGAQALNAFLRMAAGRGVVVDLLMAESSWLTPPGRVDLQKLLTFFRSFPFRAVQLDLDPELLPASAARQAAGAQVIETVRAAVASAGRPVGLTLRSSWVEGGSGNSVMDALARMNLSEIALVYYSTDAEAVAARFQAICRRYPALQFSLVQSVESDLSRSESYFSAGVSIFGQRMQKLCFDISAPNATDLIFQSWEHYLNMGR